MMMDEAAGPGGEEGVPGEPGIHAEAGGGHGATPEAEAEFQAELALDEGLASLERELETLNDRHMRLAADFDNYRRRVQAEMADSWVRAQSDLVRRLLGSLDDLQRVALLEPESATVQAIVEGVDMVERNFLKALHDAGVEVVDPHAQRFDPAVMEAVMKVPTDSVDDDDRVHQVFQRGYVLKGHLVRPARVAVLKND